MKTTLMKFLTVCLIAGFTAGYVPKTGAQEVSDQSPILLIKIPDIEKLLSNAQSLMPSTPGSNAEEQINRIRMMLFGTAWIDPERSIVAGLVSQAGQTHPVIFIPFHTPNPDFQKTYSAIAGNDYYLTVMPPQPQFAISPAVENTLVQASSTPAAGSIVLEAAVARLVEMAEAQIAPALLKMEESQPDGTLPSEFSPQDVQAIIDAMLRIVKQADIFRFGIDISKDVLALLMDIEALPDTTLAGILRDTGGETRLMDYPIETAIQYHTRAYNVSGTMDLVGSYLGTIYSQLGLDINIDEMAKMTECFTGEMAGGINLTSDGFAMEFIAVLQPGIDGEAFIRDSYLPWLERYGKSISELATGQPGEPQTMLFERTPDSSVAGLKVMGVKMNIVTPNSKGGNPFDNLALEMRMAAINDLLFMASDDAKIGEFINGTRSLVRSPASGPTGRFTLDLSALLGDIQSLLPTEQSSVALLDNLGKISSQFEMKNGTLRTRTSFNTEGLGKLISAFGAMVTQQNMNQTEGNSADITEVR
ncbi:MAG: hypothetical protein P8Y80_05640 [Acidobacteriota bacterium]|jgi:hypothetical protein